MPIPKKIIDQAMAGSALAQLEIGRYHAEGRIVPYDLEEAFRGAEHGVRPYLWSAEPKLT